MKTGEVFSVTERLRDGRQIEIRTLNPGDRDDMLAAIERTSAQSRQRRFFGIKRGFSEAEINFFTRVNATDHVALVALVKEEGGPTIVGGGRFIVTEPGRAEVAFLIVDEYQGKGIGQFLIKHLLALASGLGLRELVADVLPENAAMIRLLRKFDFETVPHGDFSVVRVARKLA